MAFWDVVSLGRKRKRFPFLQVTLAGIWEAPSRALLFEVSPAKLKGTACQMPLGNIKCIWMVTRVTSAVDSLSTSF